MHCRTMVKDTHTTDHDHTEMLVQETYQEAHTTSQQDVKSGV